MNIFCLDRDPKLAARYHCDKHVVKMILESTQLLCTPFHLQGIDAPYKKTHENHPCSIWTRESKMNYEWLIRLTKSLFDEYTHRYGKVHKSLDVFIWVVNNYHRLEFPHKTETGFPIAISPTQQCRSHPKFDELNTVEKYRLYYNVDKRYMCKWTNRATPHWFNS